MLFLGNLANAYTARGAYDAINVYMGTPPSQTQEGEKAVKIIHAPTLGGGGGGEIEMFSLLR